MWGFGCQCAVLVDEDEERRVEYKYLLIDSAIPGHVKWECGENRVVDVTGVRSFQTSDNSFGRGDSGWTPYEAGEHFLVVDDSEDEVGTSTEE